MPPRDNKPTKRRNRSRKKRSNRNVIEFPPDKAVSPVAFTPLTLLAALLKCVLRDRITDDEVEMICKNYYEAIQDIWDDV